MINNNFTPHHLTATPDDLAGNGGIGRYILLPGSDGRAKKIAEHFDNVKVNPHPRGHHLYMGTLKAGDQQIEVATIASGMGCPSMEIILHELFHLGAKRFLRVGTSGSLQPNHVKLSHLVNVQASVRDEQTTADYMPVGIPAVASLDFISAINQAAKILQLDAVTHTGTVHCKSSLYGREFGEGPLKAENERYMDLLRQCGILASEMETSALLIQSQYYNHLLRQLGQGPQYRVITGAILEIIAIPPAHFATAAEMQMATSQLIALGLEAIKALALTELIL